MALNFFQKYEENGFFEKLLIIGVVTILKKSAFLFLSILEKKLCEFWEIDYVLCRESGGYSQKNWESIVSGSKMKLFLVKRPTTKNDYSYSFDQYHNLINHIIKNIDV